MALLLFPSYVYARPDESIRLVVVASQQGGGPKIQPQVPGLIERPLRKSVHLISFADYYKAARAAGVSPKAVFGPEAVVGAGRGVAATHVLLLSSSSEGPRKKRQGSVEVTLIAVATGETLMSKRIALGRGQLTPSVALPLVSPVRERLNPSSEAVAIAAAPVTETPGLAAPPVPPTPELPALAAPPAPIPAEDPKIEPAPAAPTPPAEPNQRTVPLAPSEATAPTLPAEVTGATSEADRTAITLAEPTLSEDRSARTRSLRWRESLLVETGILIHGRTGRLNPPAGQTGYVLPCYCPQPGEQAPIFTRYVLRAAFYPAAVAGTGRWFEGFGVHFDGSLGYPGTRAGKLTSSSPSGSIGGGAQFRYVLAAGAKAPDLRLHGGYTRYSFPIRLAKAVFPGVGFQSYYLGLGARVPLGTRRLDFVLRGDVLPRVVAFGGAEKIGTQTKAGIGMHLEAGLRGHLPFGVTLLGSVTWDNWWADFTGSSRLPNTRAIFQNLGIEDRILGGYLLAGIEI